MHELDRPVWATLCSFHKGLSTGNPKARRFLPDVNLFAATVDDDADSLRALAGIVPSGERVFLAQRSRPRDFPGFSIVKAATVLQLVERRAVLPDASFDILELGPQDAAEMLALATLTEPGPFLPRTHVMGRFIGIRIEGRLAAMAGERFRFPGYTEVSGVCTHPDFRGKGLARHLSALAAAHIRARGDRPFLHSWSTNSAAVTLYQSLGFEIRAELDAVIVERTPD
jgi:predicted GNAT family acetyltransferase